MSKYYVDEDGYIMESGNSEESVARIEPEEHIEPLSQIFASHTSLVEALEHCIRHLDGLAREEAKKANVSFELCEYISSQCAKKALALAGGKEK